MWAIPAQRRATRTAAVRAAKLSRVARGFAAAAHERQGSTDAAASRTKPAALAQRAVRNLKPLSSYFPQYEEAAQRPWTTSDPDGCIVMVVAENTLMADRFLERWQRPPKLDPSALRYSMLSGMPVLRESLARFMSRCITTTPVLPENVSVGNGCGSVLDNLFHSLCEAGESIMLSAPLYPTFINDIEAKAGARPVVVPTTRANNFFPTPTDLDKAALGASSPCRVLLLCNPTNPMGTVVERSAYTEAMRWAVQRGMHVISDEIYACSVFGASTPEFVSAWDIAAEEGGDFLENVHVVYGISKDFGASGLRVGALASRHKDLLAVHNNIGYFATIPNPVQIQVADILSDDKWIDEYLTANRAALASSYERLTAALDGIGVEYVPGGASMFLWLDLRPALPPKPSWEDERRLFHLMHERGILLTPGQDCFASEPGFFRACWAASPAEGHVVAAERIASVLRG